MQKQQTRHLKGNNLSEEKARNQSSQGLRRPRMLETSSSQFSLIKRDLVKRFSHSTTNKDAAARSSGGGSGPTVGAASLYERVLFSSKSPIAKGRKGVFSAVRPEAIQLHTE